MPTHNITQFDRPTVRELQTELNVLLGEFAQKHGLKLGDLRGNFSDTSLVLKAEFLVDGADTRRQERKESSLALYAKAYLPGVDLDKEYTHPKVGKVKITGWNARAREYPVQITTVTDGKKYKIAVNDAQKLVRGG